MNQFSFATWNFCRPFLFLFVWDAHVSVTKDAKKKQTKNINKNWHKHQHADFQWIIKINQVKNIRKKTQRKKKMTIISPSWSRNIELSFIYDPKIHIKWMFIIISCIAVFEFFYSFFFFFFLFTILRWIRWIETGKINTKREPYLKFPDFNGNMQIMISFYFSQYVYRFCGLCLSTTSLHMNRFYYVFFFARKFCIKLHLFT